MMEHYVTEEFRSKIIGAFGQAGNDWIKKLPEILRYAEDKYFIKLQPPYNPLSYNYVAPALKSNGDSVVLKVGVPSNEFTCEIDALRHFGGKGMAQLVDADAEAGLILLEKVVPGVSLEDSQDDSVATSIFAELLRRLIKIPSDNESFPEICDWAKGFKRLRNRFEGKTGPLLPSTFTNAEQLFTELIDSMSNVVVLHGDLHHRNILSAKRELWLAVDPKGVMGEPEYEVGAWLRNPFPQILSTSNPKKLILRRVDQLSEELGFDRSRLIGWAYCQAALAGVWSFEESSEDWDGWFACAELFSDFL